MEFEFWWLLAFPLFFGLGWLAARIDIKHLVSESRSLPRSYFKGLNFLLNEQPDKAIEAFIEVVKVDPETIELHFALGSLFRRRGETERAIRMHQNLLERGDLGQEQRLAALFELGQDYLKAGLLDRAEEVFVKLRDTPHRGAALEGAARHLPAGKGLGKDHRRGERARRGPGQSWDKEIANYYCELAAIEMTHSRTDAARGAPGAGAQGQPQVRARQRAAGRHPRGRGRSRSGDRGVEAHRAAESRPTSRWWRSACSTATARWASRTRG